MSKEDTIKLLQECDSGSKMAVSSIDEILEQVTDDKLKTLLSKSKEHHKKLENEIHAELKNNNAEGKTPNPIVKSMAWMKTNVKMGMDNSDATVAELITDGCNMGIKSLHQYVNEYSDATQQAKDLCTKLSTIEEKLCKDLQDYL